MKATAYPQDPNSKNVIIGDVPGCGRGMFARRRFSKDDTIERAPVIVIPKRQWPDMDESIISDYAFDWGKRDEQAVIALGYVSIYNHSYSPNARLEQLPAKRMMEIIAMKDIKPGEEITINYNGNPNGTEALWFTDGPPANRNHRKR